jgi:hypothetical protein
MIIMRPARAGPRQLDLPVAAATWAPVDTSQRPELEHDRDRSP